ncbi:MAG: hypothetical protein K6T66_09340 [Peptococcaceae bacterium]|nr:hypothetical protein [Peptococcaceae bacterium]
MKKAILVVMSAALLIVGSAAFAQNTDLRPAPLREKDRYSQFSDHGKDQNMEFAAQAKERQKAISNQRAQIKELQQQLNSRIRQTKSRLNTLRKQLHTLDAGKISSIKQTLDSIKVANRVLQSTRETVQVKNSELKSARYHRRPEAFLRALDDIIDIQQKRIDTLSGILSDLERLNNQLL